MIVEVLINTETSEESVGWKQNEGWHSVEEPCPYDTEVICLTENKTQVIGYLEQVDTNLYICKCSDGCITYDITHWHKPLPLPEEEIIYE